MDYMPGEPSPTAQVLAPLADKRSMLNESSCMEHLTLAQSRLLLMTLPGPSRFSKG